MNLPVFGIPSFGIPAFDIPVFGIPDFGIPWLWNLCLGESPSVCLPYLRNPCFRNSCFRNSCFGIPFGIPTFGILAEFRHPLIRHPLDLRIRPPCTVFGPKTPKSGKEGFGVDQKPPFHPPSPKWAFRVKKSPFLYRAPQGKWGFFDSKRPFLGHSPPEGNGGFSTPQGGPFPDFGVFGPCAGRTDRNFSRIQAPLNQTPLRLPPIN